MPQLLAEIDVLDMRGDPSEVDVLSIEHDSRAVRPGALYCCLPGATTDGHTFASEAVAKGAVALLVERPVALAPGDTVVQVQVETGMARHAMAQLSAAFYGHPSRSLLMAGVTGTNGKTTVVHLLGAILAHAGHPTRVIGTLSGARTTPEATELQAILAEERDLGGADGPSRAVAMEVSSHALAQARVDGIRFDVAVFTNLSHDHLDFHGTMEDYFEAKASLFTSERTSRAVINGDDPWGRRLLGMSEVPSSAVGAADVDNVQLGLGRSTFSWRNQRVVLPLTGAVNVGNAVLAAEAAVALGLAPAVVAAGLGTVQPVPGRMEPVTASVGSVPFDVIVDYAHTPDGLEVVLSEARSIAGTARVLAVFGCGGDRDVAKRPIMGAVASRLADHTLITSDNPRGEDPAAIIAEILSGADPAAVARGTVEVEPDRRQAILRVIGLAQEGDVVVIAGKGHEQFQEQGGHRLPFDDRVVARQALDAATGRG